MLFPNVRMVHAQKKKDSLNEKKIDEVIVVGYKKQRKETLTTSVSSVSGDQLKDVASPNFFKMLYKEKMPGVTLWQLVVVKPGSQPTIRIRGISSLGATNDPLYVVDGVIVHGTGDVPPEQIESISVLKDAAATALYGGKGSCRGNCCHYKKWKRKFYWH